MRLIHDLIMNARDSEGYSDSKGIFSARKAIMQYCQLKTFQMWVSMTSTLGMGLVS